jgi:predicted nucleotidyltransferase
MERSQNSELVKRVNEAFILLGTGMTQSQIVSNLAERFGTSKIQAYRYIQQAKNHQQKLPVPENSIVFTIKLPPSLIERVRTFADTKAMTMSKVVREALEDFLAIKDHVQRKETS